jgi:hypothetical protein
MKELLTALRSLRALLNGVPSGFSWENEELDAAHKVMVEMQRVGLVTQGRHQTASTSVISVALPIIILTICVGSLIAWWWSRRKERQQAEEIARLHRQINNKLDNAARRVHDLSEQQGEILGYVDHTNEEIEIQQTLLEKKAKSTHE